MIIEYEGTDITSHVSVDRCVYEAWEEGRVPRLEIEFDDERGLWDEWRPEPGDCVSVAADGAAPTGSMYVKSCIPIASGYMLRADALPREDVKAVRVWRSTTLRTVVQQLASTLSLKTGFHGCSDMSFSYVKQDSEGALPVIARIATLAGCTFDVYDGTLHVYGRDWAESQASVGVLEVTDDTDYAYERRDAYTGCSLVQTRIADVRGELAATHGKSGRMLAVELDRRVGVSRTHELKRACQGVLACANARRSGGHAEDDSLSSFTPGSVCTVECADAPSLSGNAIVTRVRNDFENETSKVWWRNLWQ